MLGRLVIDASLWQVLTVRRSSFIRGSIRVSLGPKIVVHRAELLVALTRRRVTLWQGPLFMPSVLSR